MRNLQEQVKKIILLPKIVLAFHCLNLTVGQNNYGNKIPFTLKMYIFFWQKKADKKLTNGPGKSFPLCYNFPSILAVMKSWRKKSFFQNNQNMVLGSSK